MLTLRRSSPIVASVILSSEAWLQLKSLSATPAAAKYMALCAISIKSLGKGGLPPPSNSTDLMMRDDFLGEHIAELAMVCL
ncbi:MAG: hypothetical protein Q7T87_13115 [Polaromonas sp.]|nr:hypothetical protein [Polaromonas sp.]